MQAQLRTWKAAMVGILDEEDAPTEGGEAAQESAGATGGSERGLEAVLLARNRRLEAEVTRLRSGQEDSSEAAEAAQQQCAALTATLQEHQDLVKKLEGDLEQASSTGGGETKPSGGSGEAGGTELALGSMEAVLRDQRNRFKDKLQDCEAVLGETKAAMQVRDSRIGELTKDNTSLYGKIRYLQSYHGQQKLSQSGGGDVEAGGQDPYLAKYKDSYEDQMDPFSQFKTQERQLQIFTSVVILCKTMRATLSVTLNETSEDTLSADLSARTAAGHCRDNDGNVHLRK